jgi:hypothetical protein
MDIYNTRRTKQYTHAHTSTLHTQRMVASAWLGDHQGRPYASLIQCVKLSKYGAPINKSELKLEFVPNILWTHSTIPLSSQGPGNSTMPSNSRAELSSGARPISDEIKYGMQSKYIRVWYHSIYHRHDCLHVRSIWIRRFGSSSELRCSHSEQYPCRFAGYTLPCAIETWTAGLFTEEYWDWWPFQRSWLKSFKPRDLFCWLQEIILTTIVSFVS